jgi:hypothetical protein
MAKKNENFWLCENASKLEQFAGRWVMFDVNEGVVSCEESLDRLIKMVKKHKKVKKPFLFHVPTKDDLEGVAFLSAHKN